VKDLRVGKEAVSTKEGEAAGKKDPLEKKKGEVDDNQ